MALVCFSSGISPSVLGCCDIGVADGVELSQVLLIGFPVNTWRCPMSQESHGNIIIKNSCGEPWLFFVG